MARPTKAKKDKPKYAAEAMTLAAAQKIASALVSELRHGTERIMVAGSVRRRKSICKDIEIVAVPFKEVGLFGMEIGSLLDPILDRLEEQERLTFLKNGPRYKQLWLEKPKAKVDLFLCEPDEFGVLMAIRTGPKGFSHRLVTREENLTVDGYGLLPKGWNIRDCRLLKDGVPVPTPNEEDVFRELGLPFMDPWERDEE